MLCKTTMRAALAPVIGLLGVLVATNVSAKIEVGEDDKPVVYSGESLSSKQCTEAVGSNSCPYYKVKATPGSLLVVATTDILLPELGAGGSYYVRFDLGGGAVFADDVGDSDGPGLTSAAPIPGPDEGEADPLTAVTEADVAYRGAENQNLVIFQISGTTRPMSQRFGLDLSGGRIDNGTGTSATTDDFNTAAVAVSGLGDATVSISIHNDLSNALDGTKAIYSASAATIITVRNSLSGSVKAMVDIADVSTSVADGGPFRRFVDNPAPDDDTANAGILAMTNVAFNAALDATTGRKAVGTDLVKATNVKVTSAAGNFAIGGTAKTPWMVAEDKTCMGGGLTLDGDDAADATEATGDAELELGMNYFCVLVSGNTEPIPAVNGSAPGMNDAYMLTLTPELVADRGAGAPDSIGPMAAGAIGRNGTTVHLTYLTTNAFVDQRIVLVNRGSDAVEFWIEDTSFNLETETTLATNNLGVGMGQEIPANGRAVVTVTDNIGFDGQDRGSATINVAAPTRDIDVMTIQRSPFTDEVDTTLYQHAEL